MALNEVVLNPGSGGEKAATDLDGGTSRHYQIIKTAYGPADTFTLTSLTNPYPVRPSDGSAFYDLPPAAVVGAAHGASQKGVRLLASDGTNDRQPAALNSAPAGTEYALIVRNIPSGTQTISGTVTANAGTGPFPVSDNGGSLTVDQPTASNFNAQVVGAVAHDSPASGNPLVMAGYGSDAVPSAVSTDGDTTRFWVNKLGALKISVVDDAGDSCMDGANNAIRVNVIASSVAVTQYTEDAASAADPVGSMLMARRRDSLSGETTADGDNVALNSTDKGELYVKHADALSLAAGSNNIGDVDVLSVPAPLNVVGNGAAATALRVTLANDSTGTVVVSGSLTSVTTVGNITSNVNIVGSLSHDAPVSTQQPVVIGARGSSALPSDVSADGDVTRLWSSLKGALKVSLVDDAGDSCMDGTLDSLKVAVTNTAAIPVKHVAASSALTNVAASATNVTLLASNANRLGATLYNDSTDTLTLKLGATASSTSFTTKVKPDGYYEVPFGYTGIIDGLWSGTNGSARVTEITA